MSEFLRLKTLLLISIAFCAESGFSLVRPEVAEIDTPQWVASIHVVNEDYDINEEVCQGSLIDPYWVLSTSDCTGDYRELLPDSVWQYSETHYVVTLGASQEQLLVDSHSFSDDGVLMMFELAEASSNEVIALSDDSFESLIDVPISIFAHMESQSIWHPYTNISGEHSVYCTVDGTFFVTDDDVCYVISNPVVSESLLVARGTIVDPESDTAPQDPVDTARPFVLDGSRLYIDFRDSQSHACVEDDGASIVKGSTQDGFELVGVVASTVPYTGQLLCNPSLVNHFAAVGAYTEFIETTILQTQFAAVCPVAPTVSLEETGGSGVRVSWDEIAGAQGYNLILSYALGYSSLVELDLGNITEVATDVDPETKYSLKLLAYNAQCTSELSNTITIHLAAE